MKRTYTCCSRDVACMPMTVKDNQIPYPHCMSIVRRHPLRSVCFLCLTRNTIYSRYSTCDWDTSNKANFNLSERERSLAERLRADAWRTVKSTDQRTRNRQTSNSKRLGKCDLHFHSWLHFFKTCLLREVRRLDRREIN